MARPEEKPSYNFKCEEWKIIENQTLGCNVKVDPTTETAIFFTLEQQEDHCNNTCKHKDASCENTQKALAETFSEKEVPATAV